MPRQKISCFDAALKLLARRGFAVKEMAGKLKDKGYPGYEIAEIIDRLLEKEWLNDQKFAVERARYRAEFSRWGALRIRQELKQKGVEEGLIDQAFEALEFPEDPVYDRAHDFQETAVDLLRRRFGVFTVTTEDLDSFEERQEALKKREKEKKKRLDFLLRRGFSAQEALKALDEVMRQTD